MKQRILDDICLKLSELQIPYTTEENAVIHVSCEFYDVGDNADLKKVLYELKVFVDDENRAVHLYVSTVDQSLLKGKTPDVSARPASMFRKVKRVCFGEDGQSVVETVDLGAVPNTVKSTAFRYGWKFSTAFNMNRTARPAPAKSPGETDPPAPAGPEAPPETEPDAAALKTETETKTKKGGGFFGRLFGSSKSRRRR